MNKLLEIKDLKTYFYTDDGVIPAVDGVDITINEGETVGIVGESGSGKSVTSLTMMKLTPGKVVAGSIMFSGRNILSLSEKEMRHIRGNEMAMIFQEPMTSLNPVYTIGNQICEAIQIHMNLSRSKAVNYAIEMLRLVGIARPEQIIYEYPHQLSGGMRQRVMIAMAMACHPRLLIADEPTTALDVTIQAQILELMKELKERNNTSIMMITHDLGVVAEMCDRVFVMYCGKVVEEGNVRDIFYHPKHPYTEGLLKSIPSLDTEEERLYSIKGTVPLPGEMRKGCPFVPRCNMAMDKCLTEEPRLIKVDEGHYSRCWLNQLQEEGETYETTSN